MADLHYELGIFHERIALFPAKKAELRAARNAIRQQIRRYFHDTLGLRRPKFQSQGAYALNTLVNPLDGEYDIDDSVYLQHLDRQDDRGWPAADTVHRWLVDATDGHAIEKPMEKRTCVRIRHLRQYHVDLPCYGELNGQYRLAVKGEPRWPPSDPLALTACFRSHFNLHGEQLRRIVRCLKAWADFQSTRGVKMPGGLILTVLAASYYQDHAKDDVALANTLQVIANVTNTIYHVLNPVDISEELTARLSDAEKAQFQDAVNTAAEDANQAVTVEEDHKASRLWRQQLGERFPLVPRKKQCANSASR